MTAGLDDDGDTLWTRCAHGLGCDPARLGFTLRTAVGACVALLLGGALGLDHPQWAAMTVWIAAQPLRGHLLEKSFYRLLGSAIGVIYGVALVALGHGQPVVLVAGLTLWVSLCAGAGQLLRGFMGYGTLLSGYSAAMVALVDAGRPDHILALGADRLLTIGLGVAVALAVSARFAAPGNPDVAETRTRDLVVRRLRELAGWARGAAPPDEHARHVQLVELAALEEGLDLQVAGSVRGRRRLRALRQVITAQVGLLLWWPHARPELVARGEELGTTLDNAAQAMSQGRPAAPALARALALADRDDELSAALHHLHDAALALRAEPAEAAEAVPAVSAHPLVLHRDWIAAREAALRTGSTVLLVGLLWLVTGWHVIPFLMLGVAVMTSLFSTADDPARLMRAVFSGQLAGVAAALVVQGLLWPWTESTMGRLLACLPFILTGALVLAHPRSARLGFDYNMVGLLLLQPMHPGPFSWVLGLAEGAAVVAAPLVALLAFRWIFPPGGRRRFDQLVTQMRAEVAAMAAQPNAWERREIWRARLQHRLLRLVRWADQAGEPPGRAAREGLAVLSTGQTVLALRQALSGGQLDAAARRRARTLLQRLARAPQTPLAAGRLARALERGALHTTLGRGVDAVQLKRAARAMAHIHTD